ncbi:MAG: hypothetical protein NVS4B3_05710 [Gemmatimonadaceae bacterium]
MYRRTLVGLLALAASSAYGQSVRQEIDLGDSAHAALDPARALLHYRTAVAADSGSYEALWKAAREAVGVGELEPSSEERVRLYKEGEAYGRRAVAMNPRDPEGHFTLARAIGRTALTLGPRDRVRYATAVYNEATAALALDSLHPGANHVLGVWNAEVMRLSGFTRMIAKNLLGGRVFGEASWPKAVKYMGRAVAAEPTRVVHRLDLGKIYRDSGDMAKARAELEQALALPMGEPSDRLWQQEARSALASLH